VPLPDRQLMETPDGCGVID